MAGGHCSKPCGLIGFRGVEVWGLGFRELGFRGSGFRGLGFRGVWEPYILLYRYFGPFGLTYHRGFGSMGGLQTSAGLSVEFDSRPEVRTVLIDVF